MIVKSDPTLVADIRKYGNLRGCLQCGSCTVVCDLSSGTASFPRKIVQYALFGLRQLVQSSLEPWLCYYCGDCSTACPRQTDPGETMMTFRRYLTARYDWTGLSARLYTSRIWEIGALLAVGAFMLFLILSFHGPLVTERVELNTFAPAEMVHVFDLIMAGVLAFFLLSNAFRMYWFTMQQGAKVPIPMRLYLVEAKTLILHFVTQKVFLKCKSNWRRWLKHWLLVSGYVLMFLLVVVFLMWFQTDNIYPLYHPQRWIGYYATAVLLYGTIEILVGRLRKREQIHKFSDFSDWMFPILILLTTVSGILVHIFRYTGLPLATYYTYALHLMIAVPMLVIEVPFGKWAHLLYRPLALYLQAVKERALDEQLTKEEVVTHAA